MYSSETQIRVRYGETDRMGYVYHANYALYFEVGRTEMLRGMGFTYKEWEDAGIVMPVRSLAVNYKAPAFYDDLLTVKTTVSELSPVKISFDYKIHNEAGQLICTGNTVLVYLDASTSRITRPPDSFMTAMKELGAFD